MLVVALISLCAALPVTGVAMSPSVYPGSPAPKLEVSRWLKGGALDELPTKGIVVVDFWATWCGPCRTSIPHLTELAQKNKDVTFIGIGVFEKDSEKVDKFIQEYGPQMDYHVAYSGYHTKMAKTWMIAAGQTSIPHAFIVKDGMVQWIGHPMAMDEPLRQVQNGTLPLEQIKAEYIATTSAEMKNTALDRKLDQLMEAFDEGRRGEAHRLLDGFERAHPNDPGIKPTRLYWQAREDGLAFLSEVKGSLATGDQKLARQVSLVAMELSSHPETVKIAAQAMAMACDASTDDKAKMALPAVGLYQRAGDQESAKRYAQIGLAALGDRRGDFEDRLRDKFTDAMQGKQLVPDRSQ